MTAPTIELKQEGIIRVGGYQASQWISAIAGATDPASNASLFVLRVVEGRESVERVATPADFVTYSVNELKYFEARDAGGDHLLDAVAGDHLLVLSAPDYWLQAAAPYADASFTVAAVEALASGTACTLTPPNTLALTGYSFTDADVGRWFAVTGLSAPRVRVLAVLGGAATVDLTTTTPVTGGAWSTHRVRVTTDLGPTLEPRYFPTLERGLAWRVLRGAVVVAEGTNGATARTDPAARLFRDRRVTTVLPTADAAENFLAVTRNAVGTLQVQLATVGVTFLGTQTYDFPPP